MFKTCTINTMVAVLPENDSTSFKPPRTNYFLLHFQVKQLPLYL
jgi:hypothetical protein